MISTLIKLFTEHIMEQYSKPRGTITWFRCEDQLPPPKEFPIYDGVKYSAEVLLINKLKRIKSTSHAFTREGKSIGWILDNPEFNPTHWAFINLPHIEEAEREDNGSNDASIIEIFKG